MDFALRLHMHRPPHGGREPAAVSRTPLKFQSFCTVHSFGGEYLELKSNELIRYTDKFDDPSLPGVLQVTVMLPARHVRHRAQHRAERHSGCHPPGNVLPRLAGNR